MKKNVVYIGLGSNIEQPYLQIKKAILALHELPEITVIKDSGYFKSRPMGPKDQPDYVNAVVEIETVISAAELLKRCQQIEKQQGRIKSRHWGERTIDLDILLYADKQIQSDDLTVPHQGICLRDFVYIPLLKINPDIKIPGKGLLDDIVESSASEDLVSEGLTSEDPRSEGQTSEKDKTDYSCQFAGNIDRQ